MSMFLGPIHQWLYNKIEVGAGRASAIEGAFRGAFGAEAEGLIAGVDEKTPAFPTGLALEDIIGDSPIHGFLQGVIRMVETREGALVKAFVDKFGDKAKGVALEAAAAFGREVGEKAKGEIAQGNLESLFQALYDRMLDGMPCDQGAEPEIRGGKLVIRQSECLHKKNWESAGAPLKVMCDITGAWIKGFLGTAAPGAAYEIEASVISGAGDCRYCITPA